MQPQSTNPQSATNINPTDNLPIHPDVLLYLVAMYTYYYSAIVTEDTYRTLGYKSPYFEVYPLNFSQVSHLDVNTSSTEVSDEELTDSEQEEAEVAAAYEANRAELNKPLPEV